MSSLYVFILQLISSALNHITSMPGFKRKRITQSLMGFRRGQSRPFRPLPFSTCFAVTVPAVLRARRGSGGTELKSVDVATATFPLGTTANFGVTNVPVEGASFYNRIGRRIRMKSLHINGFITISGGNAAALTSPSYARIMVIYDRQANGANPAIADILTSVTAAGATASTVLDGINMNNRDRFSVLMDEKVLLPPIGINGATPANTSSLVSMDPNANAGDARQGQMNVNRFIKLKGLETHYKATAGAIADISTGALTLVTFGDDANATAAYNFKWTSRLKFFD